jgi:dCTP deaminase
MSERMIQPLKTKTEPQQAEGILPSQDLRRFVEDGVIAAADPIDEEQIQPASLDLRLGSKGYRIRTSFLPGQHRNVADRIEAFATHPIDLTQDAILEKNCVYIVEVQERVALPPDVEGTANPKSSIGRLDVFTRLIADNTAEFDRVPAGYDGTLYAEIAPLAFSIVVRKGSRLNQLRLLRGSPSLSEAAFSQLFAELHDPAHMPPAEESYRGGFPISVELKGEAAPGIIGYKARKHAPLIDVDRRDHYDTLDYWEPIAPVKGDGIILDPDDFYILASKEAVPVPPEYAAEMVAYDTLMGEFRVHYAGFFDPGFGYAPHGHGGTRAVLEVRSHEVPFLIEDGQIVGRLMYEKLAAEPDKLYGSGIGSSYQRQGLALSKHFRKD